jgi:hypothetical protein
MGNVIEYRDRYDVKREFESANGVSLVDFLSSAKVVGLAKYYTAP